MTNKDWTDQLPGLLEGLEEAAPEGLWDAVQAGVTPGRRRIAAAWWIGAALLTAAAVVLAVFLWKPAEIPAVLSPVALVPATPAPVSPVPEDRLAQAPAPLAVHTIPVVVAPKQPEASPEQPVREQEEAGMRPEEENPSVPEQKEPETLPEPTPEPKVQPVPTPSAPVIWPTEAPRKRAGKWLLSVSGGSLLAQAQGAQQGLGMPVGYVQTKGDAIPYGALTRNVASTTESTHRQGFRASVLMSNHFAPRWSAGTGLSLSSIHSEYVTNAQNSTQRTQKNTLYLGIPLFAQFDLFTFNRFQIYLTSGVLLEMPLQQRRNTQNWTGSQSVGSSTSLTRLQALDPGNWRWSLNLAAGVQYQLFSRGALFVQPGVCWHIPSTGKQEEDFYSARPVAPDLSLGFRFLLF